MCIDVWNHKVPVRDFALPAASFLHFHIDIAGPLPTSAGYTYCLTTVDGFTRGPEVTPSRTAQPTPWYAPSWLVGYHVSVARSSPTRVVSLNHNLSIPWPSSAAFTFLGQPLNTPQPTDSRNASTGP
jgi:hypothetical protein